MLPSATCKLVALPPWCSVFVMIYWWTSANSVRWSWNTPMLICWPGSNGLMGVGMQLDVFGPVELLTIKPSWAHVRGPPTKCGQSFPSWHLRAVATARPITIVDVKKRLRGSIIAKHNIRFWSKTWWSETRYLRLLRSDYMIEKVLDGKHAEICVGRAYATYNLVTTRMSLMKTKEQVSSESSTCEGQIWNPYGVSNCESWKTLNKWEYIEMMDWPFYLLIKINRFIRLYHINRSLTLFSNIIPQSSDLLIALSDKDQIVKWSDGSCDPSYADHGSADPLTLRQQRLSAAMLSISILDKYVKPL